MKNNTRKLYDGLLARFRAIVLHGEHWLAHQEWYTTTIQYNSGPRLSITTNNREQLSLLVTIIDKYNWLPLIEMTNLDIAESISCSIDKLSITIKRLT
jgi:hypothetical protein